MMGSLLNNAVSPCMHVGGCFGGFHASDRLHLLCYTH